MIWALLAGCAEEAPTPTAGVSFTEEIEPRLLACTGCHAGEAPDGSFDLTDGSMYDRLVEVPSGQAPDLFLVEPGNADYSYLWHKVNGTQSLAGGAGTRMPMGAPWTEADIELLRWWIELGAAP